jgi:hypothetical protein
MLRQMIVEITCLKKRVSLIFFFFLFSVTYTKAFAQNISEEDANALKRINAYKNQAIQDIESGEYNRACELLTTAHKLAEYRKLENLIDVFELKSYLTDACQKKEIRSKESMKKLHDGLNILKNNPLMDSLLGCDLIRERCLQSNNYDACMRLKGQSCLK